MAKKSNTLNVDFKGIAKLKSKKYFQLDDLPVKQASQIKSEFMQYKQVNKMGCERKMNSNVKINCPVILK